MNELSTWIPNPLAIGQRIATSDEITYLTWQIDIVANLKFKIIIKIKLYNYIYIYI